MTVRVRFFGPLATELGTGSAEIDVPDGAMPAAVSTALAERFPVQARLLRGARLAVNGRFAPPDQTVGPDDEIVVIELVGGG